MDCGSSARRSASHRAYGPHVGEAVKIDARRGDAAVAHAKRRILNRDIKPATSAPRHRLDRTCDHRLESRGMGLGAARSRNTGVMLGTLGTSRRAGPRNEAARRRADVFRAGVRASQVHNGPLRSQAARRDRDPRQMLRSTARVRDIRKGRDARPPISARHASRDPMQVPQTRRRSRRARRARDFALRR